MPEMIIVSIKFNFSRIGTIVFVSPIYYRNRAVGGLVYKMKAISVRWTYIRQLTPGLRLAGNELTGALFALSLFFIASSCTDAIAARVKVS